MMRAKTAWLLLTIATVVVATAAALPSGPAGRSGPEALPSGASSPRGDGLGPAVLPPSPPRAWTGNGPVPASTVVNPLRYERAEPAPMGVADYGIDGSGRAYNYTTPEFEGEARITSADVNATTGAGRLLGIQLDAVLVLGSPGRSFTYWVRFAPWVNTSNDVLTLQNEVFNLSSTSTANPSPISGRGSINAAESDQYQFTPPCTASYPGNCEALALPATLYLRAQSEVVDAVPRLAISYSLGSGWYSEDLIAFPSLVGREDPGFVVNGSAYTPVGNFYDAEMVVGGPYAGYVQDDRGSEIELLLEEFNGFDLQVVPNAWDFGADSSNSIENVSAQAASELGSPADVLTNGSGELGPLYSSENSSVVTVTGLPANGTLSINGTPLNYSGGEALVELAPGEYSIALVANGTVLAVTDRTFTRGEVVTIVLGAFHPVTLAERGLPGGTPWSVTWDGSLERSTAEEIVLSALNGTHTLNVTAVPGFVCNVTGERVLVQGPGTIGLDWSPFLFNVTFSEAGLPLATPWWVTLGNVTRHASTAALDLLAGNGTYPYTVGAPFRFLAGAAAGNVTVADSSASVLVYFGVRPSFLAGSFRPATADLVIDGLSASVGSGSFNVSVAPGNHTLELSAPGYLTWSARVATTPGNTTELTIALNVSASSGGPRSSGGNEGLLLLGVLAGGAAVVAALILGRRRPPNGRDGPVPARPPAG